METVSDPPIETLSVMERLEIKVVNLYMDKFLVIYGRTQWIVILCQTLYVKIH